jgi:hypothetical protein
MIPMNRSKLKAVVAVSRMRIEIWKQATGGYSGDDVETTMKLQYYEDQRR